MPMDSLQCFISVARDAWSGLNSETVTALRGALEELAMARANEPWLARIHDEKPASVELYRDERWGFILLAHTEERGLYRPPHDHGAGWVFYVLQHGEIRISTYKPIIDQRGRCALVTRGAAVKRQGECSVYLPGDIHDTECVSDYIVQFRLTSSDFSREKAEGRMTIYQEFGGSELAERT